jgi:hypothetical protein
MPNGGVLTGFATVTGRRGLLTRPSLLLLPLKGVVNSQSEHVQGNSQCLLLAHSACIRHITFELADARWTKVPYTDRINGVMSWASSLGCMFA